MQIKKTHFKFLLLYLAGPKFKRRSRCYFSWYERTPLRQQSIITLGTIRDNYPSDKAIFFYFCLDFFEENVLFTLHCVFGVGVKF